jgi:hypothetical protein
MRRRPPESKIISLVVSEYADKMGMDRDDSEQCWFDPIKKTRPAKRLSQLTPAANPSIPKTFDGVQRAELVCLFCDRSFW